MFKIFVLLVQIEIPILWLGGMLFLNIMKQSILFIIFFFLFLYFGRATVTLTGLPLNTCVQQAKLQ